MQLCLLLEIKYKCISKSIEYKSIMQFKDIDVVKTKINHNHEYDSILFQLDKTNHSLQ